MIYEKEKIRRIIEHKDNLINEQFKEDIEWLLAQYNNYYIESKDFTKKQKDYLKVLNKFFAAEEDKVQLKELIIELRHKNKILKGGNK